MTEAVTIYDAETGEVTSVSRVAPGPFIMRPGESFIGGTLDASAQFVDPVSGLPVAKPEMDITVTGNVLSGIPVGAILMANWQKDPEPITDGDHKLVVDHPQTVHVVLQHPLYLAWEREIACA